MSSKGNVSSEERAERLGWSFVWEYDTEEYQMGDLETEHPSEVLWVSLRDADGHSLASLGGIGDPSNEYRETIEHELLDEALSPTTRARYERSIGADGSGSVFSHWVVYR